MPSLAKTEPPSKKHEDEEIVMKPRGCAPLQMLTSNGELISATDIGKTWTIESTYNKSGVSVVPEKKQSHRPRWNRRSAFTQKDIQLVADGIEAAYKPGIGSIASSQPVAILVNQTTSFVLLHFVSHSSSSFE